MKKKPASPTLDDIVFECRNKEYGAYLLRKNHQAYLFRGLLVSVAVLLLFLVAITKISRFQHTRYIDNSQPYGHSVDIELPDKPYGIRSVKLSANAATPAFVLPKIVAVPDPVITKYEKSGLQTGEGNDTTVSSGEGTEKTESGEFSSRGDGIEGEVFGSADINPQFPGGQKALQEFIDENMKYQDISRSSSCKGTILIYAVIASDGSLWDIKVVRGLLPELDEEALRVVRLMPRWKPAIRNGKPVNVRCYIPITVSPIK